jgi:hypothetical protein
MSSQRELVQAMIRRRVSKAKKLKEDARAKSDHKELIMRFLSDFDEELRACQSTVEKYWLIESKPQKLLSDLQRIDPECQIELMWFGDNLDSLRLEGVKVVWGDPYHLENNSEKETIVDLTTILFGI